MNVKSDDERKSKVLKIRLNDSEFAKLKQYTEENAFIAAPCTRIITIISLNWTLKME